MGCVDKWDARFMELARADRELGAAATGRTGRSARVIVKNKRIVTTGYNGAPAGIKTCIERGECLRKKLGIASGTRARNLLRDPRGAKRDHPGGEAGRRPIEGATLYCTHQPCVICAKMIVNAGISRVVYEEGYPDDFARQIFAESGVKLERFEPGK